MVASELDVIIVGGGSSGCVLANRLSEDRSRRVLIVESGTEDNSPFLAMPRGIGHILNPGNPHVWDYEVSPGSNQPPEVWLKGKVIGGSSSINGMVYMRGQPHEYDDWKASGCTGWGWDDLGPCFRAIEDHELGPDDERGVGGPLRISVHPAGNPLCEAILAGAGEVGLPRVADVNSAAVSRNGGIGYQTRTTWKNRRLSSSRAFLDPARHRPNLTILSSTDVLKIEIDQRRVKGVTLRHKQEGARFVAARQVILSAGAIHSPKLLQLSGIGPGAVLKAAGVPVILDAPGVGANLREHRYLQTVYRVSGSSYNSSFAGFGLFRSLLQYGLFRSGPLTHAAHELAGLVKTVPGLVHCDAQIGVSLYSMKTKNGRIGVDDHDGLTVLGYFGRPESQGELYITSPDPDKKPFINANYFAAEVDRERAVSLFRWLKALGRTNALRPWIVDEMAPSAAVETADEILQSALSLGGAAQHAAGTCHMGTDDHAVLDPQLRVRGIDGLRVCDTSIMPTLVTGNTNAPAMAFAVRAAQMFDDA